MGCVYKNHEDKDLVNAISEYQNGNTSPLSNWLDKQDTITNIDHIHEIIHQVFMIGDCYFVSGTSSIFPKAFKKVNLSTEVCYLEIGKAEICPDVWLENPEDFKKLFYAYEDTFCSKQLQTSNNSLKTVADHFSRNKTNTLEGFWKAILDFHWYARTQKENINNLIPNVETWLTKVPKAKEFVQPYCHPIDGEVNFSHLAYAVLTHGFGIQKEILHLYPSGSPEKIEPFKSAAQYYELSNEVNKLNGSLDENKSQKKRLKI